MVEMVLTLMIVLVMAADDVTAVVVWVGVAEKMVVVVVMATDDVTAVVVWVRVV